MALKPITPTERALYRLHDLRKEIDLAIQELEAGLPRRRMTAKVRDELIDPVTGKVYPIRRGKRKVVK